MRRWLLAGCSAIVVLTMLSCGSSEEDAVRIGILADCEGFGAPMYDVALAGAELPLLQRGGALEGSGPREGVEGFTIGGHRVDLLLGCAGDPVGSILETRRLVEVEGADIVIGPNVLPNTPATVGYAARHPETVFVLATMERLEGLPRSPNIYRFTADSVQTAAGLGSYAYNELDWRRADTIVSPDLWEWGIYAGFVTEFCSLGGAISERYWLDAAPEELPERVAEIPIAQDRGYFLAADAGSAARFLRRYARHASIGRNVIVGPQGSVPILLDPTLIQDLGENELEGIVTTSFVPLDRRMPEWNLYDSKFDRAFPSLAEAAASSYHLFDIDYYNAMEAVLRALEEVEGEMSHNGMRFQHALASIRLDAPNGTITLDEDRQAILPIYLSTVSEDPDGSLTFRTLRTIEAVDDTYGGTVTIEGPHPDRTQPRCVKGSPPSWASVVS